MYAVEVKIYEKAIGEMLQEYLIIPAKSFKEVMDKITSLYGDDPLESVKIEWIDSDSYLVFGEEDKECFEKIRKGVY